MNFTEDFRAFVTKTLKQITLYSKKTYINICGINNNFLKLLEFITNDQNFNNQNKELMNNFFSQKTLANRIVDHELYINIHFKRITTSRKILNRILENEVELILLIYSYIDFYTGIKNIISNIIFWILVNQELIHDNLHYKNEFYGGYLNFTRLLEDTVYNATNLDN